MNKFKYSILLLVLLVVAILVKPAARSCAGGSLWDRDAEADSVESVAEEDSLGAADSYEYPTIPPFVQQLFPRSTWYADTICVAGGTVYYHAYEENTRSSVIYCPDSLIFADPAFEIFPCDDSGSKFYVGTVDKCMPTDFTDAESLRKLSALNLTLPRFVHFSKDSFAKFGLTILYSLTADFPRPTSLHADAIGKWLVGKIAESQQTEDDLPPLSAQYLGYSGNPYCQWKYDGDPNDYDRIAKYAAEMYFAVKKGEFGNDVEGYPAVLFSVLNLKARVSTDRFVSYRQYTSSHNGGAHGYYTQSLISFDHVHRQEIDFDYLFKKGSEPKILALLMDVAKNSPKSKEWEPDIMKAVAPLDDEGNRSEKIYLPQPGLSEEGVVFSFQPYEANCFAAGTYHFTIPYDRLTPYLTERAKWCIGNLQGGQRRG